MRTVWPAPGVKSSSCRVSVLYRRMETAALSLKGAHDAADVPMAARDELDVRNQRAQRVELPALDQRHFDRPAAPTGCRRFGGNLNPQRRRIRFEPQIDQPGGRRLHG